jgi:hypothetical protein
MPRMPSNVWYYGPGRCPGGYEFCDDDSTDHQRCTEIRQHGELAEQMLQYEHFHTCITCGTIYRCHQRSSDLHPVREGNGWDFDWCPECQRQGRPDPSESGIPRNPSASFGRIPIYIRRWFGRKT